MKNDNRRFIFKNRKYFIELIKKYKWAIINGQIIANADLVLMMIIPLFLKAIIDYSFTYKDFNSFTILLIVVGILYVTRIINFFIIDLGFNYIRHGFHFSMAQKVYRKIHQLQAKELSQIPSGELMYHTNANSGLFWDTIFWSFLYFTGPSVQLILALIFIFAINPLMFGVILITLFLSVFVSNKFSNSIKKEQKVFYEDRKAFDGYLYSQFSCLRDIILLGCGEKIGTAITSKMKNLHDIRMKMMKKELHMSRADAIIQLSFTLAIYVFFAYGAAVGTITLGGFVTLMTYWGMAKSSFSSLNFYLLNIKKHSVGLDSVLELLGKETEMDNKDNISQPLKGNIRFNDISFAYNTNLVLKNFSLQISQGEKIAIVGESGAGKSTLAMLLFRLYDTYSGEIFIDDINLKDFSLETIRKNIGIVNQDPYILNGSIKYNVLLGNSDADDDEIWAACKKANIAEYIKSLPQGLDTVFGENGIDCSWGQRQRICIARIFLKSPQILIFDEATSALDSEGEKIIKEVWSDLSSNRTVIIISHRLTTIFDCDHIVTLKNGIIEDYGTHYELIEKSKYYQTLFSDQYGLGDDYENGALQNI